MSHNLSFVLEWPVKLEHLDKGEMLNGERRNTCPADKKRKALKQITKLINKEINDKLYKNHSNYLDK